MCVCVCVFRTQKPDRTRYINSNRALFFGFGRGNICTESKSDLDAQVNGEQPAENPDTMQQQTGAEDELSRLRNELAIPEAPTKIDLEVPSMEDLQNVGQVVLTSAGETQVSE